MPQPPNALLLEYEGRLQLTLQAYQSGQFRSYWTAAKAFNIKRRILDLYIKGVPFCANTTPNRLKLTRTEK